MDQKVLSVQNLTCYLKNSKKEDLPLVREVSFDLLRGKTTTLIGESGSGKSLSALSLLSLLPGNIYVGKETEILFQNQSLLQLSTRQWRSIRGREMAMIFQDPMSSLNPVYSVGEQLLEVTRLHLFLDDAKGKKKIDEVFEKVGLSDREETLAKYPHELSGGMKQRIMIAMALLCRPKVLIADEPTTALDTTVQAQVLDLMKDLQEEYGTAILFITHDMGVVAEIADEVVVMYAGQVMEKGAVLDIFDQTGHPYTQALFRSSPERYQHKEFLEAIEGAVPSVSDYPTGCPFHPRCSYAKEACKKEKIDDFSLQGFGHQAKCLIHEKNVEVLSHG